MLINVQSSLTHSYSYPNTSSGRCWATSAGPPSPPHTEPPNNEEDTSSSPGIMESFSKPQDTMQIFFAVLFWMSLFFWKWSPFGQLCQIFERAMYWPQVLDSCGMLKNKMRTRARRTE
ncbi:hypothetical protein K7X08_024304 [Anisodus acutangulus]|uniref:Uncharacterized protein n=1 Tax=Anisodus acutangulus TaxID=402998 RepID=A0A9Q1RCT3_9SOLA|nr:hypothetical protein K7X08_024304 [Anisodus acutangulus]